MRQRVGESREDFRERQQAYQRKWYATRRTVNHATGAETTTYTPEREPFEPLQSGAISRRSTLVDAEGNVIQTWHVEKPEDKARWEALQVAIDEMKRDLPRAGWIKSPENTEGKMMVGYPVGDHHMGMLAWKHEVGDSYDLEIGEEMLGKATNWLVGQMPNTTHAFLPFLGDFMHYDSMAPLTPAHGNLLDADGRAAKMVRASVRTMRRMIEAVAKHHNIVHVVIEFGNHDPFSTLWLQELFRVKYEDNPRIIIDASPSLYHYYRWENNLFGTHHGDKVKPEHLPAIMATDRPKDWGETEHRFWWLGHLHNQIARDFPGCTAETFRILPPADAWAHQQGYRPRRGMQAILFHAQHGEMGRAMVNPEMLK